MHIFRGARGSIGLAVAATGVLIAFGAPSVAGAAPATSTSTSDAAYVATVSATASHQITSTFKLPKVTCKKADTGADVLDTTVSGTSSGSTFEADGVFATLSCTGTTATYSIVAVVDASTESSTITAHAGDVVNVAVIASPTFETASFSDETTGQGTFIDGAGFDPAQVAVAAQGGTGTGVFPKFAPVTFRNVTLDAKPLGNASPTAFDQVDGVGTVEISVGPLSAKGNSFVATYVTNT